MLSHAGQAYVEKNMTFEQFAQVKGTPEYPGGLPMVTNKKGVRM